MIDASGESIVDLPNRPRVWQRFLRSDLVRLLVITSCVMAYAIVFRESRGLGVGVFASPWMLGASVTAAWGQLMLLFSATTAAVLWKSKWRHANRRGFPDVRIIILPVILVLAWPFSVYEYNFFLDRSHLADRAGMVAFGILAMWRPMFIGFFVTQMGVVMAQLSFPLTFSWTDKSPLIDVLLLTQLFLIGSRIGWLRANHFIWGCIWIVAVHYFRPGIGKLEMGWLQENHLQNLVMGAIHQNSWLRFGLDDGQRAAIVNSVARFSGGIMCATLLVELSPLFYLSSRKALLMALAGVVGMHVAIFASSGIFFWKWIVLDIAIMIAVLRLSIPAVRTLFRLRHHVVFCIFLVASCMLYRTAPKLAWFDAPLCQRYHLEIVGVSGAVYQVPPSELAPFDLQFAQGRLFFADSDPKLVDCFGSCSDLRVLESTKSIRSANDLVQTQRTIGQRRYNAVSTRLLRLMLVRFVVRDAEEPKPTVFGALPDPPQHIWTFPDPDRNQDVWRWQEPAQEIRIRKLTASHQQSVRTIIQERTILSVPAE